MSSAFGMKENEQLATQLKELTLQYTMFIYASPPMVLFYCISKQRRSYDAEKPAASLARLGERHGGHLLAPGWICLQLCWVDRGGCRDGHQRLGSDLRLHHYHLQEDGRAGIQRALGRLCHGHGPLPLQAPRGHPHPARVCPSLSSTDDRRLSSGSSSYFLADNGLALYPDGPRAWSCQVPAFPAGRNPHHSPGHVRRRGDHLVPRVRPPRDHHHELWLLAVHRLDRLCPLPLRRLRHRLLLGGRPDVRRKPLLLRLGLQLPHARQERPRVSAGGSQAAVRCCGCWVCARCVGWRRRARLPSSQGKT